MLERREPNGFCFLEPVGIGQPSVSGLEIDSICLVRGKGRKPKGRKKDGKKKREREGEGGE